MQDKGPAHAFLRHPINIQENAYKKFTIRVADDKLILAYSYYDHVRFSLFSGQEPERC